MRTKKINIYNKANKLKWKAYPNVAHFYFEGVPLMEWSVHSLYLLESQVRVTVGDSGLCCCVCETSFEH